jgi:hypothetical protein
MQVNVFAPSLADEQPLLDVEGQPRARVRVLGGDRVLVWMNVSGRWHGITLPAAHHAPGWLVRPSAAPLWLVCVDDLTR